MLSHGHSDKLAEDRFSLPGRVQNLGVLSQADLAAQIREAGLVQFLRSLTPERCRMLLDRADLHVHSTFSDGTETPQQLIELALQQRMSLLVMCDHDSFDGCSELFQASQNQPLAVGTGIEVSSIHNGVYMHVLGYGFDLDRARADSELNSWLGDMLESFKERNRSMLEGLNRALREDGVPLEQLITWQEVLDLSGLDSPPPAHFQVAMQRKLEKLGIPNAFDEADRRMGYLRRGGKARPERDLSLYLPVNRLAPKIQELGGVVVVAHPMEYKDLTRKHLIELKDLGVEGLEIFGGHQKEHPLAKTVAEWEALCLALGFFPTCGSDFHGKHRRADQLGKFAIH
jgi:3',5'-nucleoside bisphosphate phosphatase